MCHPFSQHSPQMLFVQGMTQSRHSRRIVPTVRNWRSPSALVPVFAGSSHRILLPAHRLSPRNRVAVVNEKPVSMLARNRFAELVQRPFGCRMSRHVGMQNPTAAHFHDHQDMKDSKAGRHRYRKAAGRHRLCVVPDEGPPMLRTGSPPFPPITLCRPINTHGRGDTIMPSFKESSAATAPVPSSDSLAPSARSAGGSSREAAVSPFWISVARRV